MLRFISHFHRCFILIILAFFSKIMVTIRRPDERPCTIGGLYWRFFYAALKNTEDIEAGLSSRSMPSSHAMHTCLYRSKLNFNN